jgi:DNA-binding IclR family transcriptional regulator
MHSKNTPMNQSAGKVFRIVEVMAREGEPQKLQDIARKAELPQSTALRMLGTLIEYGYARQDSSTLRYSLTLKFAHIGSMIRSHFRAVDIIRPYLLALSKECGESACYAVEQDMELVYMDVADGPDGMLKIMQRIGKRAPLHCTGIGKIMLLNCSETELDLFISAKGLPPLTPQTITTKADLQKELAKIGSQGYAIDREECELGAICIAAGIRDYTGRYAGGISIAGPISRFDQKRIDAVKNLVKETAEKITSILSANNM